MRRRLDTELVLTKLPVTGQRVETIARRAQPEAAVEGARLGLRRADVLGDPLEAALEVAKAEGGNKAHSIAPNLQPVAVA